MGGDFAAVVPAILLILVGGAADSLVLTVLGGVLALAAVVVWFLFVRCPHCHKILHNASIKYCPHCGEKID